MAELVTKGGAKRQFWRGTVTANGTSTVTFTDPTITPFSDIDLTLKTAGGTVGQLLVTTVTPATTGTPGAFTFTSSAGNTSVYNVTIIG